MKTMIKRMTQMVLLCLTLLVGTTTAVAGAYAPEWLPLSDIGVVAISDTTNPATREEVVAVVLELVQGEFRYMNLEVLKPQTDLSQFADNATLTVSQQKLAKMAGGKIINGDLRDGKRFLFFDAPVIRAEVAQILYNTNSSLVQIFGNNLPTEPEQNVGDLTMAWATKAVSFCIRNGTMVGSGRDNCGIIFNPSKYISVAEIAKIAINQFSQGRVPSQVVADALVTALPKYFVKATSVPDPTPVPKPVPDPTPVPKPVPDPTPVPKPEPDPIPEPVSKVYVSFEGDNIQYPLIGLQSFTMPAKDGVVTKATIHLFLKNEPVVIINDGHKQDFTLNDVADGKVPLTKDGANHWVIPVEVFTALDDENGTEYSPTSKSTTVVTFNLDGVDYPINFDVMWKK